MNRDEKIIIEEELEDIRIIYKKVIFALPPEQINPAFILAAIWRYKAGCYSLSERQDQLVKDIIAKIKE